MNIKEIIKKELDTDKKEIGYLALYKIYQMPYFKDNNVTINFLEMKNNDCLLFTDNMNNISGFTNNMVDSLYIGLDQTDEYESQFLESDDIIGRYYDSTKLNALNELVQMLGTSINVETFKASLLDKHERDSDFLHKCYNVTNRGSYNHFEKLYKLIEAILPLDNIKSEKYKSSIYALNNDNYKGFFSFKKKTNIDEEKIYENVISNYNLKDMVREKSDPYDYLLSEDCRFGFKNIYEKINQSDMPNMTNKDKKVFLNKIKKEKNSDEGLFLAYNKNERTFRILNKNWEKLKKDILNEIQPDLEGMKRIEVKLNTHADKIENIVNKVIDQYPYLENEPNMNNIKIHIAESKPVIQESSFYNKEEQESVSKETLDKEYGEFEYLTSFFDNESDITKLKEFAQSDPFAINHMWDQSSLFNGLVFVNSDTFCSNHQTTYLIAKNGQETVGMLSLYNDSKTQNELKGIGAICVKSNYRSQSVSDLLYETLAKISLDKGWIITNSMYTEKGKRSLPNKKEKVRDKYPDFLIIDSQYAVNKYSEERCEVIERFNQNVIGMLERVNVDKSLKWNTKKITKVYNKIFNDMISEKAISCEDILKESKETMWKYNLSREMTNMFNKQLIKELSNTNKRKIK
jgi:hypothetical protein